MNKVTGVYCIRNKVNTKIYIGSSASHRGIHGRWVVHRRQLNNCKHNNKHLQDAWNKYGEDGFEFIVLEVCSPEDCLVLEQYYIDLYDTANGNNGYNICPNAGNTLGSKLSDETKAKLSLTGKGKKKTPEHIAKILAGNRMNSPEAMAKKAAKMRGKKHSPEHIAKLTAIRRTPEHRAKVAAKVAETFRKKKQEKPLYLRVVRG